MEQGKAFERLTQAKAHLAKLEDERAAASSRVAGLEAYIDEVADDPVAFAQAKENIEQARTERERLETLVGRMAHTISAAEAECAEERFTHAQSQATTTASELRAAAEAVANAAPALFAAIERLGHAIARHREASLAVTAFGTVAGAQAPVFEPRAARSAAITHIDKRLRAQGLEGSPSGLVDLIVDGDWRCKIGVRAKDPKAAPFPASGGVMVSPQQTTMVDLAALDAKGASYVPGLLGDPRIVLVPLAEQLEQVDKAWSRAIKDAEAPALALA
jgi:hypothetical protein